MKKKASKTIMTKGGLQNKLFSGIEENRLKFILGRDGIEKTRQWAKAVLKIYRVSVLKNGKDGSKAHFASRIEYRAKFIKSYLHLKRFVFHTNNKHG